MPEPGNVACLVDTGVLVDFLRGRSYTAELFRQIMKEGELAVSAITHAEVFAAVPSDAQEVTAQVLEGFISYAVTPEIAQQAGMLLNQARRRGEQAEFIDAVVAATALALDVPVITNQLARYRFPGLNLLRGQTALRRV